MKWKQALSDYAREVFGIFGSEDGREWAIPAQRFLRGINRRERPLFPRHQSVSRNWARRWCQSSIWFIGTALQGLVAERDGALLGFVHYQFHPSTWALRDSCYLEDLYVDPAARGSGVGRALIRAVYAQADRAQAATVYWLTQEFNTDGRALYDTLARRTSFIRYER